LLVELDRVHELPDEVDRSWDSESRISPTIFAELRGHIAEYPLRQRAKPGITGLAQINHHYDRSIDDVRTKVGYDLEYIRRQSLREDLRIMLKTIPVVLLRRGGW